MTAGERLVRRLAAGEEAVVEEGPLRVVADVEGSSPYGCGLRGLTVRGPHKPTRAVAEALIGLPEPLELFEAEPDRAVLRTPRARVRDRRYTEVVVTPGQVELARYQGGTAGRERLTDAVGHRALGAWVDGIVEALVDTDSDGG